MDQKDLVEKINRLKSEKNAIILVHNYQRSEIFEVADFIGDSLGLCKKAAETTADIILFCGVLFMAESAVVLNPDKKVIVPFVDAGCAMADMVEAKNLVVFKKKHPDAAVVCYVNSTAAVKAVSDICCTSSNAIEVVKSVPNKKVIFVPDKNLADYVSKHVTDKEIIAWEGYCPIHHNLNKDYVLEMKQEFPNAKIIAHPECKQEVLDISDYVASTSGMIDMAKNDDAEEFFVLTECGMTERLSRQIPDKKFHGLCNVCFDMKKNTLQSVYDALLNERVEIKVDRKISSKARIAFDRMFAITESNAK